MGCPMDYISTVLERPEHKLCGASRRVARLSRAALQDPDLSVCCEVPQWRHLNILTL